MWGRKNNRKNIRCHRRPPLSRQLIFHLLSSSFPVSHSLKRYTDQSDRFLLKRNFHTRSRRSAHILALYNDAVVLRGCLVRDGKKWSRIMCLLSKCVSWHRDNNCVDQTTITSPHPRSHVHLYVGFHIVRTVSHYLHAENMFAELSDRWTERCTRR